MVATRRQTKRLKEGSPLVLRSRATSDLPQSPGMGEDSQDHPEDGSSSDANTQGKDPPAMTNPVMDRPSSQYVEDERLSDKLASSEPDSSTVAVAQRPEENGVATDHANTDSIQDTNANAHMAPVDSQPEHIRFDGEAALEPNGASARVDGSSSPVPKATESADSDDADAAPEVSGTARSEGLANGKPLPMKRTRRKRQSQKRLRDQHPSNDSLSRPPKLKTLDPDSQSLPPAGTLIKSDSNKKRKLLDPIKEKPRKDIVKGNVIYRYEQSQQAQGVNLPPKHNPISRQLKESLLKRKKAITSARSKFLRA